MRRCVAAVVVAVAVSGCAGMPSSGPVHLGRALPAAGGLGDIDVRVLPPSWRAGLDPIGVVTGFLRAMVNDDDNYAIARTFLAGSFAARWRPATGVTTYDAVSLQREDSAAGSSSHATVVLHTPRIGRIDRRGDYEPAAGSLVTSFSVAKGNDGWRIEHAPDGVLLLASDMQRSFTAAAVYYLNRPGRTLVPEQIFLQNSQRGVPTALVNALLSGPGGWLAPAVHSGAPPRTSLIGNVPVDADGQADVNLRSSIRQASPNELAAFSAQLVWTLRQVPDVSSVRLLAEGAPLAVPGVGVRQPIASWPQYDPAAPPSTRDLLYVANGHLAATGGDTAALRRSDPGRVQSVARSRDGATLAVVQVTAAGVRLLTGGFGRRLSPRVSAAFMTPPTFDADGDVMTVVTDAAGQRLVAVTPDGTVHRVNADSALTGQPVSALRISRDGARVAAVVGAGQLLVGRVGAGAGVPSVSGFRSILPGVAGVRGVTWAGAASVVVTAAAPTGQRQIVETDADGYSVRTLSLDRLRGRPIDVSGLPGQPLYAVTDRGVIWADVDGWRRVAVGVAAVHSD